MLHRLIAPATGAIILIASSGCGRRPSHNDSPPPAHLSIDAIDSLAQVQVRLGQFERARALHEQALAMDARALRALTGIGDTYALAGDYEAARRAYERLLAASPSAPDSVQALLRIAEAFTFAGDIARAEATLEPGVELARSRDDAALEYAVLSRFNALQRWNDQLDEAEQSLAAMARIGAHASLPETTRRANALRSLQLAAMIDAKRGNEASAKRKADAYMEGRANEGLPPQREMTLGLIATYLGQHADAIAFLERAAETDGYSYLQYWLGVAHEALGNHAAAQVYFERVANWRALTPVDRLQLPLVRDLAKRRLWPRW